jgi:hypothetical protein
MRSTRIVSVSPCQLYPCLIHFLRLTYRQSFYSFFPCIILKTVLIMLKERAGKRNIVSLGQRTFASMTFQIKKMKYTWPGHHGGEHHQFIKKGGERREPSRIQHILPRNMSAQLHLIYLFLLHMQLLSMFHLSL